MKVGLVGYGRLGKLLADLLASEHDVLVSSSSLKIGKVTDKITAVTIEQVLECPVIFYAVPIGKFASVISDHANKFKNSDKLIIDVLSVKVHPKKVFESTLPKNIRALLTHPMFGPDSVKEKGLAGQPMVIDQFTSTKSELDYWKNFFSKLGLKIIEMSAEEHDVLAAKSQGITHFIGRVLEHITLQATSIDTLGAKKLLEIKEQTCNDSWDLFNDLQTLNPYTIDFRLKLGNAVENIYNKLLPNRVNKEKLVVGIQGGKGSFNEEAALYYLKRADIKDYELIYLHTSDRVLEQLHAGVVDRGQFAIHNSVGGMVDESIEAMAKYNFKIVEKFSIKIAHAMMIHPESSLEQIDTIMTHPQVLKQCKHNLEEKYSRLKQTSGEGDMIDHANVAKHLSAGELPKNIAVMGSKVLAQVYGLKLVEDNLQDLDQNFTSFLWVERM